MDSFSGHADHGELLEYFDRTGGPKRNIILVHGEEKATQALAGALRERQANPVSIAQLGSAMFRNIEFLRYPHAFRAFVLRFCVQRRVHRQPSNQVMTSGWLRWPLDPVCLRG